MDEQITKQLVQQAKNASNAKRDEKKKEQTNIKPDTLFLKPNSLFGHVDYDKSQKLRPTEEQIRTMKRRLLRQYKEIKEKNPRAYKKSIYYDTGDDTPESSINSNDESWMFRGKPKKYVPRNKMKLTKVYQPNHVNNARTRRRQIQSRINSKRATATQIEKMLKRIRKHKIQSKKKSMMSMRSIERRANRTSKLRTKRELNKLNSTKLKSAAEPPV